MLHSIWCAIISCASVMGKLQWRHKKRWLIQVVGIFFTIFCTVLLLLVWGGRSVVFGFFVVEVKSFDKCNGFGLANGFSLSKVVARLTQSLDVTVLRGDSSKCKCGSPCTSKLTVLLNFLPSFRKGGFSVSSAGAVDFGSSLSLIRLFGTSSVGGVLVSFRAVVLTFCVTARHSIYSPLLS